MEVMGVTTQEVPRALGFYLGVGLLRGMPQVGVLTQEVPRALGFYLDVQMVIR